MNAWQSISTCLRIKGYLVSTEAYKEPGEFSDGLGGFWGGRFDDGNHYSLEHQGRR